jgi:hypothetical protein
VSYVLFSDAFAGQFPLIEDVASRQILDSSGKAGNDQLFWEEVHKAAFVKSGCLLE